jgi:lipopolysaccharide transport system permease protein
MNPPVERILRAQRGWFRLDLARLLQHRDLLFMLVRRDLVSRYQQTILGPLWFLLQPLLLTGVFILVFHRGLRTSTDGVPPHLFYLSGMLLWGYFANVLAGAGNTFQLNASVFTKVYFPRLIVPLAVVLASLAPVLLQSVLFLAFYVPALLGPRTWQPDLLALALLPLAAAQAVLFALGTGLLTSGLSAKYRDLQHALPFLVQLLMFATPVIYPLSQLGERARWLAALNPLSCPVEALRLACFGAGSLTATFIALSLAGTLLVLVAGLFVFQRAERTFADTV